MTKTAKGMARSAFGEAVGVSNAMVGKWIKLGMPKRPDGLLNAAACHAWLEANVQRRIEKPSEAFTDAKTRKESALASLRELELQRKRGELIDAAEVRLAASSMVIRFREKLLALSAELCDKLAGMSDAVAVLLLLEDAIRRALQELADESEKVSR